jgi:hypothetical protein
LPGLIIIPAMARRGDVIIEFYRVGAFVKVSAVDTATLTEVSIVGPVRPCGPPFGALSTSDRGIPAVGVLPEDFGKREGTCVGAPAWGWDRFASASRFPRYP